MGEPFPLWSWIYSESSRFRDFPSVYPVAQPLPYNGGGSDKYMFSTKLGKLVKGFVLVSAMVFGVMLVSTSTTNAQQYPNNGGRYDRNDQDDRYNNDQTNQNDRYNGRDRNGNQSARFAYQRGYQAGIRQGMQDARNRNGNGRNNNGTLGNYGGYGNTDPYSNSGGYNNGNRNGSRNNTAYGQAYQRGFQKGYREGLNRYRSNRNNNNNRRRVPATTLPY